MSILIVGGDRLGNITTNLKKMGFTEIIHTTGRKTSHLCSVISHRTDLVLVLTDFVNHNLTKSIKQQTKSKDTTIVYCKRSWSHIQQSIQHILCCDGCCRQGVDK